MEKRTEVWKSVVSSVLIMALMFCCPAEALAAGSGNQANLLEGGTQIVLRVNETFKAVNTADTGIINAVVDMDVYSADGSKVLVKANTPAYIEFAAEPNGSWGKAGKICFTHATTKTIDNKQVSLRLSNCRKGGSKLGGVIVLSVLLFPIGLFSGFMKGGMPEIPAGTTFNASVMQDIATE